MLRVIKAHVITQNSQASCSHLTPLHGKFHFSWRASHSAPCCFHLLLHTGLMSGMLTVLKLYPKWCKKSEAALQPRKRCGSKWQKRLLYIVIFLWSVMRDDVTWPSRNSLIIQSLTVVICSDFNMRGTKIQPVMNLEVNKSKTRYGFFIYLFI